ncbi:MAG: hypothetical protein Q7N50_12790, partial [Armatimonadota bacterium]|nr:hypothetical protein [Armatimonadota bacterium]
MPPITDSQIEEGIVRQGAVVSGLVPFYLPGPDIRHIEYKNEGVNVVCVDPYSLSQGDPIDIVVEGVPRDALIVSQTCDIINRDTVCVAPIKHFDELAESKPELPNIIRKHRVLWAFYLEKLAMEEYPEAYADLSQLCTVGKDILRQCTIVRYPSSG